MTFYQPDHPLAASCAGQEGIVAHALTFFFTAARWLGLLGARAIHAVLNVRLPHDLIDPLGFLLFITLFALVLCLARKVALWVIAIGWAFMAIRLLMLVF